MAWWALKPRLRHTHCCQIPAQLISVLRCGKANGKDPGEPGPFQREARNACLCAMNGLVRIEVMPLEGIERALFGTHEVDEDKACDN